MAIQKANQIDETSNVIKTLTPIYINEQELYSKVVDFKATKDLKTPTLDQSLCKIAEMRLGEVSRNWSHDDFIANNMWLFAVTALPNLSENLAKNQLSAQQVLTEWENSPTHLANLMKTDTGLCIRCANIDSINYCVYISGY